MKTLEVEGEFETIVLELDDGTEQEFAIVDDVELDGQKYVLLIAILDDDVLSEDPDDMIFMRDETDENAADDEITLSMIESDEEYEAVVDAYTEAEE